MVDRGGIEPPTVTCKATVFPIIPSARNLWQTTYPTVRRHIRARNKKLGALGETRTLRTWFLRPVRIPIPSPGQSGSSAWDRTTDTLINSQVQLPLCYWGINTKMNDSKNNYRYLYNLPEDITSLPLYWTTEREFILNKTLSEQKKDFVLTELKKLGGPKG